MDDLKQWLKERSVISISRLETVCNVPNKSISKMMAGTQSLSVENKTKVETYLSNKLGYKIKLKQDTTTKKPTKKKGLTPQQLQEMVNRIK